MCREALKQNGGMLLWSKIVEIGRQDGLTKDRSKSLHHRFRLAFAYGVSMETLFCCSVRQAAYIPPAIGLEQCQNSVKVLLGHNHTREDWTSRQPHFVAAVYGDEGKVKIVKHIPMGQITLLLLKNYLVNSLCDITVSDCVLPRDLCKANE